MVTELVSVDHIVVLMSENRSFDHTLGFLYRDTGNVSASGASFDGLTGNRDLPGCQRHTGLVEKSFRAGRTLAAYSAIFALYIDRRGRRRSSCSGR
jgi:phospholipase C